ncbi:Hypothetical predicted protein [Cloeon dipterum]|uniref:Uncharacterized protein n=1 Tax=Cloeon dipterum TaxID=197152 RepID=A0A8S1E1T2_9INSE|nr:Hypothetical predicted protein [Cloeon dipterum]
MQAKVNAAYRIRDIAADFGAKLPANFSLDQFLALPEELIHKIVEKLMATRCASLRREAMEMKVLMLPVLRIYLATGPRKVDLTAFLSFCPKQMKYLYLKKSEFWISEKAADIEELSLLVCERFFASFFATADGELLQALRKLKHLKVLRIEEICDINLLDLIERLPKSSQLLEYLHFSLHQFDITLQDIISQKN